MRSEEGSYRRKVWRPLEDDEVYVKRCGFCGRYRKDLRIHWFFSGVYCISCILDVLYDNARSMEEINK